MVPDFIHYYKHMVPASFVGILVQSAIFLGSSVVVSIHPVNQPQQQLKLLSLVLENSNTDSHKSLYLFICQCVDIVINLATIYPFKYVQSLKYFLRG